MAKQTFFLFAAAVCVFLNATAVWSEADALWDQLPGMGVSKIQNSHGGMKNQRFQNARQGPGSPPPENPSPTFWGKLTGSDSENSRETATMQNSQRRSSDGGPEASTQQTILQKLQSILQRKKQKENNEPKGLMTSVQYSVTPAPFMLTPSVKRMGLAPSNNNNNRDSGAEPRMDLDENNDRLSAQVKAMEVLSTVRAMQDEIQDINEQIEKENKKLKVESSSQSASAGLESEIEQLVSEMGLEGSQSGNAKQGNAETMKSSSSIGDALRVLASRRQKIAKQSQLIAQAQLRQAESELQDQRKLKREKDILVSQIENSKRKQINTVKLKAKAKMRDAFLSRLKKKKAMDSHQALIDASNSRILSRLEGMSERRRKAAELKQERALAIQLNKSNAVKLLQQKKLANLKRQNAAKNGATRSAVSISGATALASLQTQSAVTRLSPNEKLQMLTWLDLERNSEILAKTDKKVKDKMKARLTADKLVQKAARQVVDDYDDYYDDLSDDDIDEILLSVVGGDAGLGGNTFEDDYYDDLLDEYVDDVDLLDLLGDYDLDPGPQARPLAPPLQPIQPVQPSLTPIQPLPSPQPQFGHPQFGHSPAAPVVGGGFNSLVGAPPGTSYAYFHQPTASPYHPSVTPTPFHAPAYGAGSPVTPSPFGHSSPVTPAPYFGSTPVTPTPYHTVTPTPYHHGHTPTPYHHTTPDPWTYGPRPTREPYHDKYYHDKYQHEKRPVKHETHFHLHGRQKKQHRPRPPPPPTPAVEIHHHHEKPQAPLYKEEIYHYSKPTPKPFIHFSTRPPRQYRYEQTLPPGPPYPTKQYQDPYSDPWKDDHEYDYYDHVDDYPELQFDPHKVKFYSTTPKPKPFSYTTVHPPPAHHINTYSTPITARPFHSTTGAPWHHRPTTTVAPWYHRPTTTLTPYHHEPRHLNHHRPPPQNVHYEPYDPYPHPHSRNPASRDLPGHRFIEGVSAIFDGAASGAIRPRDVGAVVGGSLLSNIQDKVHSELSLGPEGGHYTKVVVGNTTPAPPPFLPHFEPRVDITPKGAPIKRKDHSIREAYEAYRDGYARGSNDNPAKTKKKPSSPKPSVSKKGPKPQGQLSFSELMSDFLHKPLPFKAAQKDRKSG